MSEPLIHSLQDLDTPIVTTFEDHVSEIEDRTGFDLTDLEYALAEEFYMRAVKDTTTLLKEGLTVTLSNGETASRSYCLEEIRSEAVDRLTVLSSKELDFNANSEG